MSLSVIRPNNFMNVQKLFSLVAARGNDELGISEFSISNATLGHEFLFVGFFSGFAPIYEPDSREA